MSAEALSSLGAPCEENFSALCKVMGDLECEGETYVFLDNLSGAEEGIELFLSLLSRAASPALHFVVSVRTAGTESDFRFYGGRFYTLSASDFAFTKADIRAYFSLCGITLIEEEVEELYRLTDGWIFAICLQMLFYSQNKRFEKGIFESLVKKAFYARLSEREKIFISRLRPFIPFRSARRARSAARAPILSAPIWRAADLSITTKKAKNTIFTPFWRTFSARFSILCRKRREKAVF